jgi:hypothetical protein
MTPSEIDPATFRLLFDIHSIRFIVSPSSATLSLRKAAFAGIYFDNCHHQGHIKGDIM